MRMKTRIIFILIVLAAILIIDGCEKKNEDQSDLMFSGELTSHTGCKSFKSTVAEFDTPDTLSCINYSFDVSTGKLVMKHINSGFNCCPEILYCTITLNCDTIVIREDEKAALCKCNCLFDMDMEINGVEARKYQVKIIEPYAVNQEELFFEMDLATHADGSVCVVRKQYPWGVFSIQ
jgi:hypothetical protein